MDVMHKTLSFSLLISFNAVAVEPIACSRSEVSLIVDKLNSAKLTQKYESNIQLTVKSYAICSHNNLIMLDGLSFSLYKSKNKGLSYIVVDNGLLGTSKTYGPFKAK